MRIDVVDQLHGIHVGSAYDLRPRVIDWGESLHQVRWSPEWGGFLKNYIHVRMNVSDDPGYR